MGRRSYGRVLVGVLGVGGLLAAATACGASAGDDKDPEVRSFSLPGRTLTVDANDSDLEIVSRDGLKEGKIQVTRWFEGSVTVGRSPKVSWEMAGDRLKLRVRCAGMFSNCSARHRVEVPRGVSVAVQGKDGGIRAEGFRDPLTVDAHDGSVHVTNTSGPLTLRGHDGKVTADVGSVDVQAEVHDGSLELRLSKPPRSLRTSGNDGGTLIEVPAGKYHVTTDCEDGHVDVSVPRDDHSSHVIDSRSRDGGITMRTAN